MDSWKIKFALLLVIVGLLSACAAPAAEEPTVPPTEEAAPATQAPTAVPAATDTSAPASEPTTASVPTAEPAAGGPTVSFAAEVLPLLESRCVNCHGGQRTEEGLVLTNHAGLITGSENGPVIIPGDGVNSLLVQLVADGDMPKRGPKLTPPQVQLIADWINQGALDN